MKLLQAVQQFVQVYVMNIHKTSVCVRMCVSACVCVSDMPSVTAFDVIEDRTI